MRMARSLASLLFLSSFRDDVPRFRRKRLKAELDAIDRDTAEAEERARQIGMLPGPASQQAPSPAPGSEIDSSKPELESVRETAAGEDRPNMKEQKQAD